MRIMTPDEMDRMLRRSVMKRFLWGEVHTVDGEIVVCIRGNETTVSATDACRLADAAERVSCGCSVGELECGWVEPTRAIFLIKNGGQVVELIECSANEFAAALRTAVASLSQSSGVRNRTDDNLRSVFG